MSCQPCRQAILHGDAAQSYPYRWKNANVEIIGCREHVAEIIAALNTAQIGVIHHGPDQGARLLPGPWPIPGGPQ